MPDKEEMEQMVSEQIDRELFTEDEKRIIRSMIAHDQGPSRLNQLAEETAKGGEGK